MKTKKDISINDARQSLSWAKAYLEEKKIPQQDAEYILSMIMQRKRFDLLLENPRISRSQFEEFKRLMDIRAEGYPLQYILGNVSFMGINLDVNEGVLIPRPETEILIEKVSGMLKPKAYSQLLIADIGTGSGNIAIGLTKIMENCKILAVDISEKAVNTAQNNARKNQVAERITFFVGDMFSPIDKEYEGRLDAVISNPPYIPKKQIGRLQKELGYEPEAALNGGEDGLDIIRILAEQAYRFLKEGGMLALEIGMGQKGDIKELLKKAGFKNIRFFKDYNNIDRVAAAEKGASWISW
jgi:release factor glutamine methyltransferase